MGTDLIPVDAPFYWLHASIAIFGIFTLVYGLGAFVYKSKLFLSEVVIATVIGIVLGRFVTSYLSPLNQWSDHFDIFLEISKIVIGLQLMATGLELTPSYLIGSMSSLLILLFPVLILSWLVSALFLFAIFFDTLDFWECLLVAACITPTDPVIASAIVKGKFSEKYIAENVRNLIEAESGANDGLALPFFYLPLIFLSSSYAGKSVGEKVGLYWIVEVWLYQVILMSVIGLLVGAVFGVLAILADWKKSIDKESYFGFNLALTALVLGGVELLGGDSILAVFFAGIAFSWSGRYRDKLRITEVNDAVDLITTFFFILMGTILPFDKWADIGVGKLIGVSTLLLLFKRLPFVMLFKPVTRQIKTWKESVFVGWFGPVGVAGLFYSLLAYEELRDEKYFNIVSFIIFFSVLVHGMTAAPFSKILGFLVRKDAEGKRKKSKQQRRRQEREKRKEMRVLRRRKNELLSGDTEMQEMQVEKELEENEAEESGKWNEEDDDDEEQKEEMEQHSGERGKTYSEEDAQRQERRRKMREFSLSLKLERRREAKKKGKDKDDENPSQEEDKPNEPEEEQAKKQKEERENDRRKRRGRRRRETVEEEEAEEVDFESAVQFLRSLWRRLMREGLVGEEGPEGSAHGSVRSDAGDPEDSTTPTTQR